MGGGGGDTGDELEGSAFVGAPLAAAVVEALPRVRGLLEHGSAREQMRAAGLLTALLCAAPPAAQLRALAARRVLRAALLAFFADDRNGGGRQDFLRTTLMRGLSAALQCAEPAVHRALLHDGQLLTRLAAALGPRSRTSREHARLLLTALQEASRRRSLGALLAALPGWDALQSLAARPVGARECAAMRKLDDGAASPVHRPMHHAEDDAENVNPNRHASPQSPQSPLSPAAAVAAASSPKAPLSPASLYFGADDEVEVERHEGGAGEVEVERHEGGAGEVEVGAEPKVKALAQQQQRSAAEQRSASPAPARSGPQRPTRPGTPVVCRRPSEMAPWSPPTADAADATDADGATEDADEADRADDDAAARAAADTEAAAARTTAAATDGAPPPSPPLLVVERASLRVAQDFSRDTPQPKLVSKRDYLHRRAKEDSPFASGLTRDGSSPRATPASSFFPASPAGGASDGLDDDHAAAAAAAGAAAREGIQGPEDHAGNEDSDGDGALAAAAPGYMRGVERLNTAVKSLQF